MKLVNHNEEETAHSGFYDNNITLSDTLRLVEDKFYKIFDLNPCPMSIGDLSNSTIIDVNDAFVKTIGLKSKRDVIGMPVSGSGGLNLIDNKDLAIVQKRNSRER